MRHTRIGLLGTAFAAALLAIVSMPGSASATQPSCNPKNCNQVGAACGSPDNGCGSPLNCGTCNQGKSCVSYQCVTSCTPKTCAQLGATCGSVSDGCGGTLSCGTCGSNQTCSASTNTCVANCTPTTCGQLSAQCGSPPDGCGSTLNCGSCASGKSCSSGYQCVTACTPATCTSLGAACGTSVSDGCGGTLNCGSCTSGKSCNASYQCVSGCTAATCNSLNAACGTPSDGCGGTLSCGSCNGNKVCDASYQCVAGGGNSCTPTTCSALGANCGTPSNGCGGTLSCGSCASGLSCSYGNVCVSASTAATVGSTFAAGSLIIPMDQCYQKTDGSAPYGYNSSNQCVAKTALTCGASGTYPGGDMRHAFGLIYLLASNQIPVHIILRNDKTTFSDTDFTVTPSGSATLPPIYALTYASGAYTTNASLTTLTSSSSVNYLGMPFVVEASFAQQALQVIGAFNAANSGVFAGVNIHVANYPFTAPIFSTLATRPKPVGIGPNFGQITYFDESGITSVVPAGASYVQVNGSGTSWSYTWPSSYFGSNPACPSDNCTSLAPTIAGAPYRIIDTLWTGDSNIQNWSALSEFFQNGGRALVVDTAVSDWEAKSGGKKFLGGSEGLTGASRGKAGSDFCGAMATTNGNAWPGPTLNYPSSDPYLQIGDLEYTPVGGGQSGTWSFNGIPALNTDGITSFDVDNKGNKQNYFSAIHGKAVVSGAQTTGHVIYEGGGNAWHGATTNKDAGLHIMYNTLINSTDDMINGWANSEMTRSSPVGRLTGESYLGTFDWNLPPNPTLPGNVLWTPSSSTYPYLTGHFREYKPAATGSSSLAASCSTSDANSPCNWDAANGIPRWSSRRVYVGTGSWGSYTLSTASSMTTDATITYISTRLDRTVSGSTIGIMGGVDYGTGAVIEGKPSGRVTVAGATGRPTIAYVGARDGMLHAFCVVPEAGQTACYGTYAVGTEIWAIIPPFVKAQMDAARVAGDWSKVNVGGAIRVADVQDTFGGVTPAAYRTVLVAGTRDGGSVFALDISNPNPANLNNDGLKILWANDGTHVASGVTSYTMGQTQGTTFAVPGTSSPYAIATAAATGSTAGINTYVMRMRDGVIVSSNQKLFTRRIPIAGGSSADMPSSVPAMPTVIDSNGSGNDNAVLVADVEGIVRKFSINASGTLGTAVTLFDTSTVSGCTSGQSCQPLGVSPSIARRGSSLGAFIGTGGVDWARGQSTLSRVFGFDPASASTATAFFNQALTTVQNPVAAGSNATAADMPVRVYSQLSISGTDMYALGTTLAVDTYNQLLLPSLRPGTYGQVYRWGNVNATLDTSATLLITQGSNFAGGVASALITSGGTDGVLTLQGTNSVLRTSLVSTSARNTTQNTSLVAASRPYTTTGWFDLAE